ncbi:hypothetical protein QCA50_014475 [Cerrena zonata]|uniref:Phosphoglycerate mutase-like protein n=1 Tax=Cerrena zonata TaxID=2478898 RepID=A0AAW0FY95_9APHY
MGTAESSTFLAAEPQKKRLKNKSLHSALSSVNMVGLGLATKFLVTYSAVAGFFAQDSASVNSTALGAIPPRFGLLDDAAGHWTRFKLNVTHLNAHASHGTSYKVFFLGRHGQGYHNVAESTYGTTAWDDHWSKLTGDGNITWGPDALLTPTGETQAAGARTAWKKELADGVPLPTKFISSPLRRALDTWKITFAEAPKGEKPVLELNRRKALIYENAREMYGVHTCDERSNKTTLVNLYPRQTYTFESPFPEQDPLWDADVRESSAHVVERALTILDKAFQSSDTYISITAHSGFITGFLTAIGHPKYSLPTGGMIPVVVKVSRTSS